MRRNSGPSFRNSGPFTSPGTPEYGDYSVGWNSERVPSNSNTSSSSSRRHATAAAALISGRTLPSKWDDAERWITTSPLSGFSWTQPQRRPKSKSGPIGLAYSPPVTYSPLTTGVLLPDGFSVHYEAAKSATNIMRSASVSDFLTQNCGPVSQDDSKEDEGVVSRRDMATQMSPEGSSHSSSNGRLSFSNSLSLHRNPADVRDVQVDKGTTTAQPSNVQDLPRAWEASKSTTKLEREEAKINAWENLQKAKAEAAIRKLEMKLERKRSASMDRITNKLRGAQMKARAMRNSLSDETCRTSHKGFSRCVYVRFRSICSCFLCRKS